MAHICSFSLKYHNHLYVVQWHFHPRLPKLFLLNKFWGPVPIYYLSKVSTISDEVGTSKYCQVPSAFMMTAKGSIYLHEMYLFCMAIVWKSLFLVDPARWALVLVLSRIQFEFMGLEYRVWLWSLGFLDCSGGFVVRLTKLGSEQHIT